MKHSKAWEWSDLTSDDVSLVADFIAATEAFDDAPIRTPFSEVASYFGAECPWKAQGAWAGDTLVAFGLARIISNTQWETTITLSGSVHPQWRAQGVGTDLLERQVEVAHALAGARAARALLYVEADHKNLVALAEGFGFSRLASFVQIRGKTTTRLSAPALSDYIAIEPMGDGVIDDIRGIHNVVVSESALFDIQTAESWAAVLEDVDREWCFVAVDRFGDRPRIVGYLLASVFVSIVDGMEASEAYIDEVVVIPQWRNSGVGSAMVTAVLQRFQEAGYDSVVADVAIADPDGSAFMDVFDETGFAEIGRTHVMSLQLNQ